MKNLLLLLRNTLCFGILASLLVSCGSSPIAGKDVFNGDGYYYKTALRDAIVRADRIVVEEHSHQTDFLGVIKNVNKAPRYSYDQKTLTSSQKAQLIQDVSGMNARTRTMFTMCAFVPHHTLYFYQQDKIISKLEICYKCGDVKWNGTKRTMPAKLISSLTPTVKSIGFSPRRNWKQIAASTYKSKQSPPDPEPQGKKKHKVPTAKPVPGRPGFYFNPFTQNMVDCVGIPAGTKVRDPQDPDKTHAFRLP